MAQSTSSAPAPGSHNSLASALRRLPSTWRQQSALGKLVLAFVALCLLACPCLTACTICGLLSPESSQRAQLTPTLAEALRLPTQTATVPPSTPSPSPTGTPTATSAATSAPTVAPASTPTPSALAATLKVHFIDVGQGDAILIQSPDGKAALIDGGPDSYSVLKYLSSQGVKSLDLVVATHPHSDHIGGLIDVLRLMPVAEVVTNGQLHTTSTYERFLDAIAAAQARYTEVKRGDQLQLGSLTFQVLHPATNTGDDLNNNSLVLRLVYGQVSFLFTGDVQSDGEADMLRAGQTVTADVLKVAHHGSHSSSTPLLLDAVQPKVAIYSCGIDNSYGHPHSETLANLAAAGASVYGTDLNGTVVVTSDGSGYSITTTKSSEPRSPPAVLVPTEAPAPTQQPATVPAPADNCAYIANSNTGKFHRADCRYVAQMSPEHKVCYATGEQAIAAGYIPCKVCNP